MLTLVFAKFGNFFFAATSCNLPGAGKYTFFGIPHWWQYLKGELDPLNQCVPAFSFPGDLLAVGLAVLDMMLRVAGLVAIVSIIAAGVGYITAAGTVEKTASARRRIYNSLIGLAVVAIASGFVAFIGNTLGK